MNLQLTHRKTADILIVDDNAANLKVLNQILADEGFKVRKSTGGRVALRAIEVRAPDLILLDIKMPDMDGYTVCRHLRAEKSTAAIPVIFVSALDDVLDKVKAFQVGGNDYITKPFYAQEIIARVDNLLTIRRQNQRLQQEIEKRKQAESDLIAAYEELQRLANLDGLTQMANRRHFDECLLLEWQRCARERQFLSLILTDVDYFKPYNDTFGHQMGDECLRQVAAALRAKIKRPADLVARYGGEEFAIILPNTEVNGARLVAEQIQRNINELQIAHPQSMVKDTLTLSFGIASFVPQLEADASTLLAAADQALYAAKQQGRDRIVVSDCQA